MILEQIATGTGNLIVDIACSPFFQITLRKFTLNLVIQQFCCKLKLPKNANLIYIYSVKKKGAASFI